MKALSAHAGVLIPVCTNVSCSVALVAINKILFSVLGFRFVILLSAIHFFAGAALLKVMSDVLKLFETRSADPTRMARLAAAGAVSIVLTNYSLRFNAMGTYQVLKTAVLPAVMALSYVQGRRVPTKTDVMAAGLVIMGSCMSIMSDVSFAGIGAMIGVTAVVLTAQYQIWSGSEQRELQLSPLQVMVASMLPQGLFSLGASVLLESSALSSLAALTVVPASATVAQGGSAAAAGASVGDDLLSHVWTAPQIGYIALSAVFACGLNWSSFAIIGKTSATTMQIINQTKTVLIIAADLLFFPKANVDFGHLAMFLLGIVLVVSGATWYGVANSAPAATAVKSLPATSVASSSASASFESHSSNNGASAPQLQPGAHGAASGAAAGASGRLVSETMGSSNSLDVHGSAASHAGSGPSSPPPVYMSANGSGGGAASRLAELQLRDHGQSSSLAIGLHAKLASASGLSERGSALHSSAQAGAGGSVSASSR